MGAPGSDVGMSSDPPGWRRRLLLFLVGAAAWTVLASYPNPAVFARNLARYRRLPIDPRIEPRMGWDLPGQPGSIELFVDSLILAASDWQLYRVPWYVPTAGEVARVRRGDCEAKTILFASLLAGKHIPFEVRASLNHIWVDYPGRRPRPGESQDLAYLEGRPGRLRVHWPRRLQWAECLAVQRQQLWEEMPLARKSLWLIGLSWLALAAVAVGSPGFEGAIRSDWRTPGWHLLARAAWLAAVVLGVVAIAPSVVRQRPAQWTMADLWEVLSLSVVAGALLGWLSVLRAPRGVTVSPDGAQVMAFSARGWRRRRRELNRGDITHLQLDASPGGLRPWVLSAALPSGEKVPLLYHRRELNARAALRSLGRALQLPLVVRADGSQSRATPEEIPRSLRERAARRPSVAILPRPRGCDLQIEEAPGRWTMRYPATGRSWIMLLAMALFPVTLAAGLTYAILRLPLFVAFWGGWVIATVFLGLTTYLAILLKGEVVARLADSHVEVGEGELRYYTPERTVERIGLDQVEGIELGRLGETPTVAVVSPDRVIHMRGICVPEHRAWVRQQLEDAVVRTG